MDDHVAAADQRSDDGDSSSSPLSDLSASPECPSDFDVFSVVSTDRSAGQLAASMDGDASPDGSIILDSIAVDGSEVTPLSPEQEDEDEGEHEEEQGMTEPQEPPPQEPLSDEKNTDEPMEQTAIPVTEDESKIATDEPSEYITPPLESSQTKPEGEHAQQPEQPERAEQPERPEQPEQPEQAANPVETSAEMTSKPTIDIPTKPESTVVEMIEAAVVPMRDTAALRLPPLRDEHQPSFASSLSAMTDHSEASSRPTSQSSKATTPVEVDALPDAAAPQIAQPAILEASAATASALPDLLPSILPRPRSSGPSTPLQLSLPSSPTQQTHRRHQPPILASPKFSSPRRPVHKVRPKSSIPLDLAARDYARQCVAAAESSRLNPYGLHNEEHALLRQHLSHAQVTTYLNIRNGILRLWMRKPHVSVTRHEAIGCAKDRRWFDVASVCFDWLCRRGYINFGCVEIREPRNKGHSMATNDPSQSGAPPQKRRRKRIVVIGAGMAGLGCARQLENLFQQYADQFETLNEEPPEVVVLEGRDRIGGRVYSRPFQVQPKNPILPGASHSRATAEMGGMIITGFDRGNPINILLRGQLGLGYHALYSETTLYDIDGKPVDPVRDGMVENLFNECLDRVSEYKFKLPVPKPVEGSRSLMDEGRDASTSDGHRTIAFVEDAAAAAAASSSAQANDTPPSNDLVPVSSDRLTGRAHLAPSTFATLQAAYKVKLMGWDLKPGVAESKDLDLDPAANAPGATLGFVVEEAIRQYKDIVDLRPQDFRLLNWHVANLEYSNAISHDRLSLQGWDIDAGNEWEGKHSMVIGGYQSVPRGLMECPTALRVERRKVVTKIAYGNTEEAAAPATVECEDGQIFEADYVVNTIPLGVLKHGSVAFDPPLPAWKTDAIRRLGYGVLNKIHLTYRRPFWDLKRDIFGVLREPADRLSLDQADYAQRRGRMFQWFNVTNTTGIPCLVALMAGDAGHDTETASNADLVAEATAVLRSVFGAQNVPEPVEAIVTRWASDRFSRGSYSSAGPEMKVDDYDVMARPVGRQLFFAGEHTIGTHPATVHGAYLSGLQVASVVLEALLGPIAVPTPLVIPKELALSLKRKAALEDEGAAAAVLLGGLSGGDETSSTLSGGSGSSHRDAKASMRRRLEARERQIQEHIAGQIGSRPLQPARVIDTSYLLFSKAHYERARAQCEERRRPGKGRPLPNEVRVLTSKMWRSASAEERQPFVQQAAAQKQRYLAALAAFNQAAGAWDLRAAELRAAYDEAHPSGSSSTAVSGPFALDQDPRSPSVPGSVAATPDQPSPYGGRRRRRMASYHVEADSDVEMTG